jgi:hypothetical protein
MPCSMSPSSRRPLPNVLVEVLEQDGLGLGLYANTSRRTNRPS